jgi:inner membrane transporter RhtA
MATRPLPLSSASPLAPVFAVAGSMVSTSIGASIAKTLFPVAGALGIVSLRLLFAALILSTTFRVWRVPFDRRTLSAALPYGLALAGMNLTFYLSLARLPLGIAIGIEFIGPLAVTLAASRQRTDFLWLGLAVAGLALMLPLAGAHDTIDPLGAALAAIAGIFWGAYILTGKRAGATLGVQAPALGMIIGTVIALPFGIATAGRVLLDLHVLWIGLLVALLSSAIPYTLDMFSLTRLPAKSYGILISAAPAVGALIGLILLGEMLAPIKWLGIAAVVLASAGTIRSTSAEAREAAELPVP